MQTTLDLSALADDGDTLELDDGRMLRLRVRHDEFFSINDFDCYGETEPYSHRYDYDEQYAPRPAHFTGNAEKIECDRGYWIWWEPPADAPKRGTDEFARFRSHVIDLIRDGFYVVTLELCEGTDAYGRPIVVDMASIGGCAFEHGPDGYKPADVVRDLIVEVLP
jgi:hypothetical protein